MFKLLDEPPILNVVADIESMRAQVTLTSGTEIQKAEMLLAPVFSRANYKSVCEPDGSCILINEERYYILREWKDRFHVESFYVIVEDNYDESRVVLRMLADPAEGVFSEIERGVKYRLGDVLISVNSPTSGKEH